jgi:hypothetical protein
MTEIPDHLRGPWAAYLLDEDGFAFRSADQARTESPGTEFQVAIVRRTGEPKQVGDRRRLPGFVFPRDLIWIAEEELPLDGDDQLLGAGDLLRRADAMAYGLNAFGGAW